MDEEGVRRRPIIVKDRSLRGQLKVDHKLNQQFRYFREEFISVAASYGMTLPLNLKEDKTGRIFNFVHQGGPGFIIQTWRSEDLDPTILKISLSLLVVTLSVLETSMLPTESDGMNFEYIDNSADSLQDWIRSSINKMVEGGAVSAVVSIVLHTSLQEIQSLALCFLSHLMSISPEAAAQILQPQNSRLSYQHGVDRFTPRTTEEGPKSAKKKTIPKLRKHNDPKSAVVVEKKSTCIAYILTICATFRNRLGLISNCADIITSVSNVYPDGYFAYQIAKSSTCTLPSVSLQRHYTHHRDLLEGDGLANGNLGARAYVQQQQQNQQPGQNGPGEGSGNSQGIDSFAKRTQVGIIPWIGVKLLLKFMQRAHIFGLDHEQLIEKASSRVGFDSESKGATISDGEQNIEVKKIYEKVVVALCTMVFKSQEVARYVCHLPGAEELIRIAAESLADNESITRIINRSRRALMAAKKAEHDEHERNLQALSLPAHLAHLSTKGVKMVKHDEASKLHQDSLNIGKSHGYNDNTRSHQVPFRLEPLQSLAPTSTSNESSSPSSGAESDYVSQTDFVFASLGLDLNLREPQKLDDLNDDLGSVSASVASADNRSVDWLLKHSIQKPQLPAVFPGILDSKVDVMQRGGPRLASIASDTNRKVIKPRKSDNQNISTRKKGVRNGGMQLAPLNYTPIKVPVEVDDAMEDIY